MGAKKTVLGIVLLAAYAFSDIGSWDTTGLRWAIMPNALYLGDNPAAFNTGVFPVYQGNLAPHKIVATLTNMGSGYGYAGNGRIKFDDTNDYLSVIDTITVTDGSKETIEVWLEYHVEPGTQYILHNYTDNDNGREVKINGDETLQLGYNVGGSLQRAHGSTTLSGGLNHLVFVKDGSTLELYINGAESAYAAQDSYTHGNQTYNNASFGAKITGVTLAYDSYFIAVYDSAFDSARVVDHYNNGRTLGGLRGYDSGDSTMTILWPLSAIRNSKWDNTDCVFALPFASWSRGNGADQNSGQMPSYPDTSFQDFTFTSMGTGSGYFRDSLGCIFDGSNDHFVTNYNPYFTDGNKITFEVKLNYVSDGGDQIIFESIDDGSNSWDFRIKGTANNKIQLLFFKSAVLDYALSTDTLADGDHTIHGVKDGAAIKLYIDGSEVSAYDVQNNYELGVASYTDNMDIGSRVPLSSKVYWIAVYQDALSNGRISKNHSLGNNMKLKGMSTGKIMSLVHPTNYHDPKYFKWLSRTWMSWTRRLKEKR